MELAVNLSTIVTISDALCPPHAILLLIGAVGYQLSIRDFDWNGVQFARYPLSNLLSFEMQYDSLVIHCPYAIFVIV